MHYYYLSPAQVVLIQVALQTTESNELAGGVSEAVSRVNSRFSTLTYQPVIFLHVRIYFLYREYYNKQVHTGPGFDL